MTKRPGRNDPCPCGSGLKYKRCHLGIVDAGPAENLDEVINEATEAISSQDPAELKQGLTALERLRWRADLTPAQRATIQLNLTSGLQFAGQHREALDVLGRLREDASTDPHTGLWIALKTGVSLGALGDVEGASRCFEAALARSSRTDDVLLRASIALEAGKLRKRLGDVDGASRFWEEALRDYETAGDQQHVARTRSNLAALDLNHPDPERQKEAVRLLKDLAQEKLAHHRLSIAFASAHRHGGHCSTRTTLEPFGLTPRT
jgi:tetratricopeptide (TPR) repeat protein